MEQLILPLRVTGLLAVLGAFLYAIGDVLLLTSKVDLEHYPKLKPFKKLIFDAERMVVLSHSRMLWGALIGVFSTPLVLAGFWQVYQGLSLAGPCHRPALRRSLCRGRLRTWHILLHGRIHPGVESGG